MSHNLEALREKCPEQVRAILNMLVESPYFYRRDNEELFLFLRRNQQEFREFYRAWFGWDLIMDVKCARVYKDTWFNQAVKPANRLLFRLGRRDECIAFMLLLEYFEKLLDENAMTVEEPHNPRFTFGDLLEYQRQRFAELFPEETGKYSAEHLRKNVLHPLMPRLIKYRLLEEIPRPPGFQATRDQYIYEALPALYHYNTGGLVGELGRTIAEGAPDMEAEDGNDGETEDDREQE